MATNMAAGHPDTAALCPAAEIVVLIGHPEAGQHWHMMSLWLWV